METVEITVARRTEHGKGPVRRMRAAGKLPAVFYGPKREAVSIVVSVQDFEQKFAHLEGSHLIRLLAAAGDAELHDKMVLLREIQRHPVTGHFLHADFYEVDLTRRLLVSVPLRFVGKAEGVVAGGILQPILREVQVECLPTEIPDFLEIDVSHLGIHDTVHLAELKQPSGVSAVGDATLTLVTVLPPTIEAAKPVEAAEAAEAAAVAPAAEGEAPGAAPAPQAAPPKKGGGEG